MLTLGPTRGIFVNAAFYLPLLLWLVRAPYGRHFRGDGRRAEARGARPRRHRADHARHPRRAGDRRDDAAAGMASFFVGNSYQAQMPGFAHDLRPRRSRRRLHRCCSAPTPPGALLAGFLLESRGGWLRTRASSAERIALAVGRGAARRSRSRAPTPLALPFLFLAGFFELSFSSMAQTLVQMNAPETIRGRVLGLFNMSSSGLRTFSGLTVGIAGSIVSIHTSLAASSIAFMIVVAILMTRQRPAAGVGAPAEWIHASVDCRGSRAESARRAFRCQPPRPRPTGFRPRYGALQSKTGTD